MPAVNWLAVIAATIAAFMLGGLWYSPLLFAKAWQRAAGLSDEAIANANLPMIFGLAFVFTALATVYLNEVVNFGHGH